MCRSCRLTSVSYTHLDVYKRQTNILLNAVEQVAQQGEDGTLIIGRVPELDGFVVVSGFSGHGFMHGPIAGLLVSEIVLDGRAHTLDIDQLGYERFAARRLVTEYNVI